MTTVSHDIELLIQACHIAYQADKQLAPPKNVYAQSARESKVACHTQNITDKGYRVEESAAYSSATKRRIRLGYSVLKPSAPEDDSPLIIAYRGTNNKEDLSPNSHLIIRGETSQEHSNAAYQIYTDYRQQYPKRTFILCGHSLGGYLAQYVGIRALNESEKPLMENLTVRTFNTAPIRTKFASILTKHPALSRHFVNYRINNDLVSLAAYKTSAFLGEMYTFSISSSYSYRNAHSLSSFGFVLPEHLMKLPIGSDDHDNILKEKITGCFRSYQSSVRSLFLSSIRKSHQSAKKLCVVIKDIIKDIEQNEMHAAIKKINAFKKEEVDENSFNSLSKVVDKIKSTLIFSSDAETIIPHLKEVISELKQSYSHRVKSQFFSSCRLGSKKLASLIENEKKLLEYIDNKKLDDAEQLCQTLLEEIKKREGNKKHPGVFIQTLTVIHSNIIAAQAAIEKNTNTSVARNQCES